MPLFTLILVIIFAIIIIRGLSFLSKISNIFRSPNRQQQSRRNSNNPSSDEIGKQFSKNEGKYIDFEEIKEE